MVGAWTYMVSVLVSRTTANSSVSSRALGLGSCPLVLDTFFPRFLLYLFSHIIQGLIGAF